MVGVTSMRLILTTIFAAIAVFLVILTTRIWGQGQSYNSLEHVFLTGATPYVIVKAETLPSIEQAIALKSDAIIWLDARVSADNFIFLLNKSEDQRFLAMKKKEQEANPNSFILKGGKLSHYAWEEINAFYKETPVLKEVYLKFPTQRFIVNLVDNSMDVNAALVSALKDTNADERTLVQSSTLVVMTSTKELKPEWLYGTSQADLMRLMSFDSMWVLPSTQFKGDVFIAPFSLLKRPAFNDDIISEIQRRHKKIFLGPVTSEAEFQNASRLNADGFITDNLPQLLEWLDQGKTQ